MRKLKKMAAVNFFAVVLAASMLFGGTCVLAGEINEENSKEIAEENQGELLEEPTGEIEEAITEAAYKIEHYVSDTKEGPFTLEYTEEYTEIPGTVIEANPMIFEDYVFEESNGSNITSGTVAEDGSLVLKFYYVKERYPLKIHYVYENGKKAAEDYLGMYLSEEAFLVKSPAIEGFTANYSEIKSGSGGMIKGGIEVTVTYVEDKKQEDPEDPTDPGESEEQEPPVYEESPQPEEESPAPAPAKKPKKKVVAAPRMDSDEADDEAVEEESVEESSKENDSSSETEETKDSEATDQKQEELKEIENEEPPLTQMEIGHKGIVDYLPYLIVILAIAVVVLFVRRRQ